MPANHTDLEKRLWDAADELRANSKLKCPAALAIGRKSEVVNTASSDGLTERGLIPLDIVSRLAKPHPSIL